MNQWLRQSPLKMQEIRNNPERFKEFHTEHGYRTLIELDEWGNPVKRIEEDPETWTALKTFHTIRKNQCINCENIIKPYKDFYVWWTTSSYGLLLRQSNGWCEECAKREQALSWDEVCKMEGFVVTTHQSQHKTDWSENADGSVSYYVTDEGIV